MQDESNGSTAIAAMATLALAIAALADDMRAGVEEPAVGDELIAQMKKQSDILADAIAAAMAAMGAVKIGA